LSKESRSIDCRGIATARVGTVSVGTVRRYGSGIFTPRYPPPASTASNASVNCPARSRTSTGAATLPWSANGSSTCSTSASPAGLASPSARHPPEATRSSPGPLAPQQVRPDLRQLLEQARALLGLLHRVPRKKPVQMRRPHSHRLTRTGQPGGQNMPSGQTQRDLTASCAEPVDQVRDGQQAIGGKRAPASRDHHERVHRSRIGPPCWQREQLSVLSSAGKRRTRNHGHTSGETGASPGHAT